MMLTGSAVCFPLIGHPVAQVRSPPVINAYFARHNIEAVMFPLDLSPSSVPAFFDLLRGWGNCGGVSVTVPYKRVAFDAMDEVTERAARTGSVNIVRRAPDGTLHGDMTDGLAFVAALTANRIVIAGARALLFGSAGGAGSAIAWALCNAGLDAIRLVDLEEQRNAALAASLRRAFPRCNVETGISAGQDFSLAVNASTLGMHPDDPLPFDPARLGPSCAVADIVTKPVITPLLRRAGEHGLAIATGEDMARAQLEFQMRHLGLWANPEEDEVEAS